MVGSQYPDKLYPVYAMPGHRGSKDLVVTLEEGVRAIVLGVPSHLPRNLQEVWVGNITQERGRYVGYAVPKIQTAEARQAEQIYQLIISFRDKPPFVAAECDEAIRAMYPIDAAVEVLRDHHHERIVGNRTAAERMYGEIEDCIERIDWTVNGGIIHPGSTLDQLFIGVGRTKSVRMDAFYSMFSWEWRDFQDQADRRDGRFRADTRSSRDW